MARYSVDLKDIEFNLFEFLKIQEHQSYGLDEVDSKGILTEYHKFIAQKVFPSREPSDLEGVKHIDGKVYAPKCFHEFHKSYYDNGWFSLGLPEEIGGTPVPVALQAACLSFLIGANCAYGLYPELSRGALNVIRLKASEDLKKKYIPGMMDGRWGGTMCLTEAGAGSDVGALRSTATPNGDGSFNIKGVKIFISGGETDLYENSIHLVLARTPEGVEGTKGISLFLVPRVLVNDDSSLGKHNNVDCTKIEHKMGIHASATCELTFGGNGDCKGWLVGDEFDGMATMFIMMNEARLTCGVQGESQGNLAYEFAKHYAQERIQFKKEIVHHPDVKRMLLKSRAVSRGMRALILYTANLFDKHEEDRIGLLTPICKSYCTEEGLQVSIDSVQVHGGYGFCQEYGVEQFVRDSVIGKIYEGTNGIQATDLVMRKIIKDEGKTLKKLLGEISEFTKNLGPEFSAQQKTFIHALGTYEKIMATMNEYVGAKKYNHILQNCHDVLMMTSHLVVAWLLGKQAVTEVKGTFSEDYLKSKKDDFKLYCLYYLSKNSGLAHTINANKDDLLDLVI